MAESLIGKRTVRTTSQVKRVKTTVGVGLGSWVIVVLVGCSAAPPMIQDGDGGTSPVERGAEEGDGGNGAVTRGACIDPAPGCPCQDVGSEAYCGMVYRKSGTHVDCSPGYVTCEADGVWGACVGDSIWDGG